MPVITGTNTADTIAATNANDTIFGLSGFDTLTSSFERADIRGGWGQDQISVDYDYVLVDGGPYPLMRWALSGDQGNDTISADVNITDFNPFGNSFAAQDLDTEIIVDGGLGNDTVTLNTSIDISNGAFFYDFFPNVVSITNAVVDLDGDNSVSIVSSLAIEDTDLAIDTTVLFGAGDDTLAVNNASEAFNFNGAAIYDINLGNGDNTADITDRSGNLDLVLTSGSGNDTVDILLDIDNGNSAGYRAIADIDLGAGDDQLTLNITGQFPEDMDATIRVDLGSGTNAAVINDAYGAVYNIHSGADDDTVALSWSGADGFNMPGYTTSSVIDLGDGNNTLNVDFVGIDQTDTGPSVQATTGAGNDTINISGGRGNTISSGAGNDTITAGSGTDTISSGSGDDAINIDRSAFANTAFGTQRLTITDFDLAGGDSLNLSGWSIPALGGGTIDDAGDLTALQSAAGDVLSFVQVGADALLTLDLGGGEVGEILFQNLDLSAPVIDPPMVLNGGAGDDILNGGNNNDVIFLRRGDDVATGGDGADVFRFNAVSAHNNDGDHHVITDLDFLEGDVLRFHNFGAAWADDATDPANALTYLPGAFNTWVADSLADLQELAASGALATSALAGGAGTEVSYLDNSGDQVSIDLWGIIV
ncbi:MAG: calcium-binding protein [Albidovulum sp.]